MNLLPNRPLPAISLRALVGCATGCEPSAPPPPEWNDAVVMEIETCQSTRGRKKYRGAEP